MQKRMFHHFELLERLGLGGMSEVFRGVHQTLGYPVAIKILDPRLAQNPTFIGRFEFEAKAASNLHNNRIVSVIDFGVEDETYFIVMEYVDGHDLKWLLDQIGEDPSLPGRAGLPAEIALMLLEEVALGLKAAHDQKIIHRDIKPSNILVSRSGEVKLTDFGLGRDFGGLGRFSSEDLTLPGTVMGTPAYMSPEQAAGRREDIDYRTDIFSLGVLAYDLLTGEKPFKGDNLASVLERIVKEDPAPITPDRCALANPDLELLVERMLKKDPGKRFQSVDQVLAAIQGCMESLDNTLFRYRNEYLARFAQDPAGFSKEMVRLSIRSHLKLGYYFKNLGQSNIDDALQHFSFVRTLDPENPAARAVIDELRQQLREPPADEGAARPPEGISQPVSSRDLRLPPTKILSDLDEEAAARDTVRMKRKGPQIPQTPPGVPKPRRWRVPILVGGGVVAVAALGIALSRLPDRPPPAAVPLTADFLRSAAPEAPAPSPLPAPASGGGTLALTTVPPGARVAARPRGAPQAFTPLGASPARVDLAVGDWEVEVALSGFVSDTLSVSIRPGRSSERSTSLRAWTSGATVTIDTNPAGASASVRAAGSSEPFRPLGLTPLTGDMAPGSWEMKVEKEGFRPEKRRLDLKSGMPERLEIVLRRAGDAFLSFRVKPAADVYLDGKQVLEKEGKALVKVLGGNSHHLELRHAPSFAHIDFEVNPEVGDTVNLGDVAFHFGTLSVNCNMTAKITVDGSEQNRYTPWRLERIGVGEHWIGVAREGAVVRRAELQDAKGKTILPLSPRRGEDGVSQFKIEVPEGQVIGISFEMEKSASAPR